MVHLNKKLTQENKSKLFDISADVMKFDKQEAELLSASLCWYRLGFLRGQESVLDGNQDIHSK